MRNLPTVHLPRHYILRSVMPQIEDVDGFLRWLKIRGYHHRYLPISPAHLIPTQGEINLNRSVKLIELGLDTVTYPVLISGTNHILDGHHRWYAAEILKTKVECVKILVSTNVLCRLAQSYPKVIHHGIEVMDGLNA